MFQPFTDRIYHNTSIFPLSTEDFMNSLHYEFSLLQCVTSQLNLLIIAVLFNRTHGVMDELETLSPSTFCLVTRDTVSTPRMKLILFPLL
jgi:hypothetical protein